MVQKIVVIPRNDPFLKQMRSNVYSETRIQYRQDLTYHRGRFTLSRLRRTPERHACLNVEIPYPEVSAVGDIVTKGNRPRPRPRHAVTVAWVRARPRPPGGAGAPRAGSRSTVRGVRHADCVRYLAAPLISTPRVRS